MRTGEGQVRVLVGSIRRILTSYSVGVAYERILNLILSKESHQYFIDGTGNERRGRGKSRRERMSDGRLEGTEGRSMVAERETVRCHGR